MLGPSFALLVGSAAARSLAPRGLITDISNLAGTPNLDGFSIPTLSKSKGGQATCVSGFVSVDATTTQNLDFDYQIPNNQTQVTETFLDFITPGESFVQQITGSQRTVSGTYKIGATLCTPVGGNTPSGVQLLTHGVGFDRAYWDFASGYSYVDVAASKGYATFSYDRLGVGLSAKPDPVKTIQAPLEVEIARTLAAGLRKGRFSDISFSTVVGVGHSFGSIITEALTAQHPDSLDAAILTGYSVYQDAMPVFVQGINLALANRNQPLRFGVLNNGFLVSDTVISNQIGFFRAPGFDPSILTKSEATKGTVTFGELFTISTVQAPAKSWTKPVAVVNGAQDLPFCFGNCNLNNKAQAVKPAMYPNVADEDFGTYLAPNTGHGLNLHYSASDAFAYIQDFIAGHGLAP